MDRNIKHQRQPDQTDKQQNSRENPNQDTRHPPNAWRQPIHRHQQRQPDPIHPQQNNHESNTRNAWRQPVFQPGPRKEEMIARDRMRTQPLGGKSKKDALGSVAASWGPIETRTYGMFEIEEDPPSRSTSPFREQEAQRPSRDQVRVAKKEALEKARRGTPYQ